METAQNVRLLQLAGEFEQHPGIAGLDIKEHQLDIAAKRLPCGFGGSLIYPVHHTILVSETKQKARDPKTFLGRLKIWVLKSESNPRGQNSNLQT